jgi:hypothetical protein
MWKLFAIVFVMSDTGSVSVSNMATDFSDPQACKLAATQLYPQIIERDVGGHHISIRTSADCRPDGVPPPLPPPTIAMPIPPPFAQFFRR